MKYIDSDLIWNCCLKEAKKAFKVGDVPIGALVLKKNKIISMGHNTRQKKHNVLGHAEINAILDASRHLKRWNLSDCDLYVTLKPCSMCENVIKQSRIANVYYLADKLSIKNEFNKTKFEKVDIKNENFNEQMYIKMLSDFFASKR